MTTPTAANRQLDNLRRAVDVPDRCWATACERDPGHRGRHGRPSKTETRRRAQREHVDRVIAEVREEADRTGSVDRISGAQRRLFEAETTSPRRPPEQQMPPTQAQPSALQVLLTGWNALSALERHAEISGGYLLSLDTTVQPCMPCSRFHAAAIRRLGSPDQLMHIRCPQAQEWVRQVRAADALVRRLAARDGRDGKGAL